MYMQVASLYDEVEKEQCISATSQRVDILRNVTCACSYALTGGIPYDGWSEAMVIAEVTKGYQMPKPDHVDNKL